MNEIKVKVYGLVDFTKRQYLITQGIIFAILIILFVWSYTSDFSTSEYAVLRYLDVGSAVILILELFETVFMLKKFSSKAEALNS